MQFFPATPSEAFLKEAKGSLAEYKKTGGEEELFLKTGSCDLNRALRDAESLHASFYHRALIPSRSRTP